jgi:hypothetical protein
VLEDKIEDGERSEPGSSGAVHRAMSMHGRDIPSQWRLSLSAAQQAVGTPVGSTNMCDASDAYRKSCIVNHSVSIFLSASTQP